MIPSFGIYIGNSTMSLAFNKDGKTNVVANDLGDRTTPAVVAKTEREFIVGANAKSMLTRQPKMTAVACKRLIDEKIAESEITKIVGSDNSNVVKENAKVVYKFTCEQESTSLPPEEILALLFKKMFAVARNTVNEEPPLRAVLSVPIHFSQNARKVFRKAAEKSGFLVLQIISEPAAAMLAHWIGQNNPAQVLNVLVYRLGGKTCDVSFVTVADAMYHVVVTTHCHDVGGDDFTKILADYLASEFMQKYKLNPLESRRSMNKLMLHAENCKHVLSTVTSSHIFIESLHEGVDWSMNVTRPRFENIISQYLPKYVNPIDKVLSEVRALHEGKEIKLDKVVLCGGSTKIPKLQSIIKSMFPDAELVSARPEEVIAEGCALHASFLREPWDPDCQFLNVPLEELKSGVYPPAELN